MKNEKHFRTFQNLKMIHMIHMIHQIVGRVPYNTCRNMSSKGLGLFSLACHCWLNHRSSRSITVLPIRSSLPISSWSITSIFTKTKTKTEAQVRFKKYYETCADTEVRQKKWLIWLIWEIRVIFSARWIDLSLSVYIYIFQIVKEVTSTTTTRKSSVTWTTSAAE